MDDRTTIVVGESPTHLLGCEPGDFAEVGGEIIELGKVVRYEVGDVCWEVGRTWRERLFTRPWRPWVKYKEVMRPTLCPVFECKRERGGGF
jgi:hypothetical protein